MICFRKASYSVHNGGCVEVGETVTDFRKSRRSLNHGACVEAGTGRHGIVVRDTVQAGMTGRTALAFPASAWQQFTASLR
jgi:Domain of unknown function (DUF397)